MVYNNPNPNPNPNPDPSLLVALILTLTHILSVQTCEGFTSSVLQFVATYLPQWRRGATITTGTTFRRENTDAQLTQSALSASLTPTHCTINDILCLQIVCIVIAIITSNVCYGRRFCLAFVCLCVWAYLRIRCLILNLMWDASSTVCPSLVSNTIDKSGSFFK